MVTYLSVLIPTYNEEKNIGRIIKDIKKTMRYVTKNFEIIVMDGKSKDKTTIIAKNNGAKVFLRSSSEFATFFKEGLTKCSGRYIITLDTDGSHPPTYIRALWQNRKNADIIIASKWVAGSKVDMPNFRVFVSKTFNFLFKLLLNMKINDMNSNYRLYNNKIKELTLDSKGSEILPEILIKAQRKGFKINEIPFYYKNRRQGKSKFKLLKYSIDYLKLLVNTIE